MDNKVSETESGWENGSFVINLLKRERLHLLLEDSSEKKTTAKGQMQNKSYTLYPQMIIYQRKAETIALVTQFFYFQENNIKSDNKINFTLLVFCKSRLSKGKLVSA